MPRVLVLRPSAKINLTLRVGPVGTDGFHDVRTLLQSISLSDRLTLSVRRGPFAMSTNAPGVPVDRTNLVWRAADLLWRDLGRPGEPRGVAVTLDKRIPVAAGLGGGSADAAAALVGLNRLWRGRRSRADLVRIAAGLGADVPFFLTGGTALGLGRGDELYPLADIGRLAIAIVVPSFGVPTADAYRWLDEDRQDREGGRRPLKGPARAAGLDLRWPGGPVTVFNDLERPVTRRHPEIAEIVGACRRGGALAAAMTGSGSAVFAVFPAPALKRAGRQLERPGWRVLLTRAIGRRETERRVGL